MKLRKQNGDKNLVLGSNQNFRTDAGWDESFQTYQREVLEDIINPVENYETCRYIHKPYTSNGIEQTDIWLQFLFKKNGSYNDGLDYYRVGIEQSDNKIETLKNSFFKLEFYKTPNNDPPNRQNRRLVFSKNLNPMVGEDLILDTGQEIKIPVFCGTPFRNKENMYLFWFEDDTVLEESVLTGGTFYMTAKFYNAYNGDKTQFLNSDLGNDVVPVEEEDLYFLVEMDRTNEPTYNYAIYVYDPYGFGKGGRVGSPISPIKFYEMGGNVGSGNTPTPSSTTVLTPTPSSTVVLTPTPSPSSTPQGAFASWSDGTSNSHGGSIPGDNPSTGTTTGTVTVNGGAVTVKVSSYKPFNYANTSVSELIIGSIGTISATNASGNSTTITSTGQLTLPVGTYPYTINTILTIDGGLTSGAAVSNIVNV